MSAFRYTAVDAAGSEKKGQLDADNERAARAQLRDTGLIPLTLETTAAPQHTARSRQLSQTQLVDFTRQLASLVAAGLPLERALANQAAEAESRQLKTLLEAIRAGVAGGQSLAATLATYPTDFSEVYRGMVAAGEASGSMATVLLRLATWLETSQALRTKLTQACIYPVIVVTVAILVVGALLTFVVPQVVGVFANARQKLPPLTVITLAVSCAAGGCRFYAPASRARGQPGGRCASPCCGAASINGCSAFRLSGRWCATATQHALAPPSARWRARACRYSRRYRPPHKRWVIRRCAPAPNVHKTPCVKAAAWHAHSARVGAFRRR